MHKTIHSARNPWTASLVAVLIVAALSFFAAACNEHKDESTAASPANDNRTIEHPIHEPSNGESTIHESSTDESPVDELPTDEPLADQPRADVYTLTVLATNDIHGQIDFLPEYATIVKQIRDEQPNVLLLDVGDVFKRGPHEQHQGRIEIALFNHMGYDAMVLGNNEFKVPNSRHSTYNAGTLAESDAQIANLVKWADFPILCGNVTMKETGGYMDGVKPYIVKTVGALRVGIIGITSTQPADQRLDMAVDKVFIRGDQAVRQLLPAVREESDIQIVLSHAGFSIDERIENVSAVIGGHDHRILNDHKNIHGVPVTQGGGEIVYLLVRLDLNFVHDNGQWILQSSEHKLYTAAGDVEKDAELQEMLDAFKCNPPPMPMADETNNEPTAAVLPFCLPERLAG
jgi:5'-nucleotidase